MPKITQPPILSAMFIDVNKDWLGYIIKNLGAPVDPNDSARKTDVDGVSASLTTHEGATTGVHGVGTSYIAKTANATQVMSHGELTGIGPDDHHAQLHSASHAVGGADELPAASISDAMLASGAGLADGNLCKLPTATEGQLLGRGATAWQAVLAVYQNREWLRSLAKEFLNWRTYAVESTTPDGTITYADPYIVLTVLAGAATTTVVAYVRSVQTFLYETLEFSGLLEESGAATGLVHNCLPSFSSGTDPIADSDVVLVGQDSERELFRTTSAGVATSTLLDATEDWTVERAFRVEWEPGSARLYRDGVLIATHTANVPSVALNVISAARTSGTSPTADISIRFKPDFTVR